MKRLVLGRECVRPLRVCLHQTCPESETSDVGAAFFQMCSGSEAGSYLRLVDVVYHSTLGLRVIKKKRRVAFFHPSGSVGGAIFGNFPQILS